LPRRRTRDCLQECEQTEVLLLFILLGPLEQLLQHLGVLEPVIKLSVLLLVLRWVGAQTMESQWISVLHNLVHGG
jgi:hypothetical protein